jgi:hypothetical protein
MGVVMLIRAGIAEGPKPPGSVLRRQVQGLPELQTEVHAGSAWGHRLLLSLRHRLRRVRQRQGAQVKAETKAALGEVQDALSA